MIFRRILLFTWTVSVCLALTIPKSPSSYSRAIVLNKREGNPPTPYDLSWVGSYSAIGDSYSAGLGVGEVTDEDCSRYDSGFPQMIDATIFVDPTVKNIACTGATSKDVAEKQLSQLEDGKVDLITVSAGGNDVGFSDVLKACVYLSTTQEACDKALDDASKKIDGMKGDVDKLLQGLAGKLTDQGLIVYVLYAKFWNEVDNYCNDETWSFFDKLAIAKGLKLTSDNRKKMNKLVDDVNDALQQVVASATSSTRQPIAIELAEWNSAVHDHGGYFCSDAEEKDAAGSDDILMFIRENGSPYPGDQPSRKLRYLERQIDGTHEASDSPSNSSALADRATPSNLRSSSNAPDSSSGQTEAVNAVNHASVPDAIAKVFHPSFQGQQTIADAVYLALIKGRAKKLDVDFKMKPCTSFSIPGLKCFTDDNGDWKATDSWTTQEAAAAAVDDFCKGGKKSVNAPNDDELAGGKYWLEDSFGKGTLDELKLRIDIFQNKAISEDDCKAYFHNTIDGCDGNQPEKNPKNLKYGGTKDVDGGKGNGFVFTFQPLHKHLNIDVKCYDLEPDISKAKYMNEAVLTQNADTFTKFITDPVNKDRDNGEQVYNDNEEHDKRPDKVKFIWRKPQGAPIPSVDDLKEGLGRANGGCQVPHGDYNPSNFKYGAEIHFGSQMVVNIEPQENNVLTDGSGDGWIIKDSVELGDTGSNGKKIDKPTLQRCLRDMATVGWRDPKECEGMVSFVYNSLDWLSPSDCHNACKNQLSEQISKGARRATCTAQKLSAICFLAMGYKPAS